MNNRYDEGGRNCHWYAATTRIGAQNSFQNTDWFEEWVEGSRKCKIDSKNQVHKFCAQ